MTYQPPVGLARLSGIDIRHTADLPQGDVVYVGRTMHVGTRRLTAAEELLLRARHTGRMIVRRGLAHVLEQLGEDVEPESLFDGVFPVRGQRWDGRRFVWPDELPDHPCGHLEVRPGCGGCDPGAIEWVIEDGSVVWRRVSDGDAEFLDAEFA